MTDQPRHSVSLTLVRPGIDGPEIFWGRRALDRTFLAGFHSFFAGSVEPDDPSDLAAALRECFEECGLLFTQDGLKLIPLSERTPELFQKSTLQITAPRAVDPEQNTASPTGHTTAPRTVDPEQNTASRTGHTTAPRAVDLGWWRTPTWLSPSFITHFFALLLTDKQGRQLAKLPNFLDPDEFVSGEWLSATAALSSWRKGKAYLTTPLINILKSLAQENQPSFSDTPPILGATPDGAPTSEAIEIVGGTSMLPLQTPTLPPATHTNTIIIGEQDFIVIDPGPSKVEALRPLLEHIDSRITSGHRFVGIALTHHHPDHVGGLSILAEHFDIPLLAHRETLSRLPAYLHQVRELHDGDSLLPDSSHEFISLHTPGHAPGHLVFYQQASGLLIAGDLITSEGTIVIDPPDGHMGAYLQSLRRVHQLAPRAILPSHGHLVIRPIELIEHYIAHRTQREARVLDALRFHGSATPKNLVPLVYPDLPQQIWPLATRSLLAHLIHLVETGYATTHNGLYTPIKID